MAVVMPHLHISKFVGFLLSDDGTEFKILCCHNAFGLIDSLVQRNDNEAMPFPLIVLVPLETMFAKDGRRAVIIVRHGCAIVCHRLW